MERGAKLDVQDRRLDGSEPKLAPGSMRLDAADFGIDPLDVGKDSGDGRPQLVERTHVVAVRLGDFFGRSDRALEFEEEVVVAHPCTPYSRPSLSRPPSGGLAQRASGQVSSKTMPRSG